MPNGSFYFGKDGFQYKKMGGGGNRRVLPLAAICNKSTDINNRYVSGSGVGGLSVSTRRAMKLKAGTCSQFCNKSSLITNFNLIT
jgi:hypothetical protein